MKSDNQNKIGARHASPFSRIEKVHPVKMLLYLCLGGIGVLFFMLLLAYARTEAPAMQTQLLPYSRYFSVSTLLILCSSYVLARAPKYYRKDKLTKMGRALGITLFIGLLFMLSQVLGWLELAENGLSLQGKPLGSYWYLITALHALHLAAGIAFLVYVYFQGLAAAQDAIRTLFYIRDPYRKLQLSLLTTYWHFLTGLWVFLFLVFLFLP